MPTLDIDPDLRLARTPPAALYTDPAWRAAVAERVLGGGWQQLWQIDEAGDAEVIPVEVGLEPMVLVRGASGERLLSNVCTHRGALLVDGPCRTRGTIRCPYHGRKFHLDGTVRSAPGFGDDWGPGDALKGGVVAATGPLRWGALEPDVPFEQWWGPVRDRLAHVGFRWEALRYAPDGDRVHAIAAPWMLYLENFLEGFHVPYVHPELSRALEVGDYRHELLPHGTLQVGIAKPGDPAFEPTTGPEAGQRVAAFWFWLWPTTLVNVYPWGVSLNLLQDDGPGRCTVRYRAWVLDESLRGRGAGGALDLVEHQDQEVVLRAWRGVQSRLYGRGRYSPEHERGVHHFHRMLAQRLS